jgi:hypothetical protein
MTMPHDHNRAGVDPMRDPKGSGGHGWMMIACCIPMLVIAVVLVATGIVSVAWLFVALMCTAMMFMMMRGMRGM